MIRSISWTIIAAINAMIDAPMNCSVVKASRSVETPKYITKEITFIMITLWLCFTRKGAIIYYLIHERKGGAHPQSVKTPPIRNST